MLYKGTMNQAVPEVEGDFIPLRVTFDREPYVVCVGDAYQSTARVELNGQPCGINQGKWTSPPISYRPDMEVVVTLISIKGKSREIRTVLPGPDALGPVYGPDWEGFVPAS